MMSARTFAIGLLSTTLFASGEACTLSVPQGRLVCDTSSDCPRDWYCHADRRCYATTDVAGTDVGVGADVGVDVGTDVGVDAGRTFMEVDVSLNSRFTAILPGDQGDFLMWPDGTIVVEGSEVSPTGVVSPITYHYGRRAMVWPRASLPLMISGYQGIVAVDRTGTVQWSLATGCCRIQQRDPMFAVSMSDGMGYGTGGGNAMGAFSLADSSVTATTDVPAFLDIEVSSGGLVYAINRFEAKLYRVNRSTNSRAWTMDLAGGAPYPHDTLPIAAGSDGSVYMATPSISHFVHVAPNQAIIFDIALKATCSPVISARDLALIGFDDGTDVGVKAIRIADGSVAWSATTGGVVNDLALGDDGLVYALTNTNVVHGFDVSTGMLLRTYLYVGGSTELMLRDGVMYVKGVAKIIAFDVDAQGYEVGSPWPVKYHDNYRSMGSEVPFGD